MQELHILGAKLKTQSESVSQLYARAHQEFQEAEQMKEEAEMIHRKVNDLRNNYERDSRLLNADIVKVEREKLDILREKKQLAQLRVCIFVGFRIRFFLFSAVVFIHSPSIIHLSTCYYMITCFVSFPFSLLRTSCFWPNHSQDQLSVEQSRVQRQSTRLGNTSSVEGYKENRDTSMRVPNSDASVRMNYTSSPVARPVARYEREVNTTDVSTSSPLRKRSATLSRETSRMLSSSLRSMKKDAQNMRGFVADQQTYLSKSQIVDDSF